MLSLLYKSTVGSEWTITMDSIVKTNVAVSKLGAEVRRVSREVERIEKIEMVCALVNISKMHILGTIWYTYLHNQKKLNPCS